MFRRSRILVDTHNQNCQGAIATLQERATVQSVFWENISSSLWCFNCFGNRGACGCSAIWQLEKYSSLTLEALRFITQRHVPKVVTLRYWLHELSILLWQDRSLSNKKQTNRRLYYASLNRIVPRFHLTMKYRPLSTSWHTLWMKATWGCEGWANISIISIKKQIFFYITVAGEGDIMSRGLQIF